MAVVVIGKVRCIFIIFTSLLSTFLCVYFKCIQSDHLFALCHYVCLGCLRAYFSRTCSVWIQDVLFSYLFSFYTAKHVSVFIDIGINLSPVLWVKNFYSRHCRHTQRWEKGKLKLLCKTVSIYPTKNSKLYRRVVHQSLSSPYGSLFHPAQT